MKLKLIALLLTFTTVKSKWVPNANELEDWMNANSEMVMRGYDPEELLEAYRHQTSKRSMEDVEHHKAKPEWFHYLF